MSLECALRGRLRTVLVCSMLEVGVMVGVPIRPQQIQELLHTLNQPTFAHVLKEEDRAGDGEKKKGTGCEEHPVPRRVR